MKSQPVSQLILASALLASAAACASGPEEPAGPAYVPTFEEALYRGEAQEEAAAPSTEFAAGPEAAHDADGSDAAIAETDGSSLEAQLAAAAVAADDAAGSSADETVAMETTAGDPIALSVVESVPAAAPKPAPPANIDEALRQVFDSPSFGRHLAESYLAVTDVEPTVTTVDYEYMTEILELVVDEEFAKALKLIDKNGSGPAASAVFDFTRGSIYYQQERYEDAEKSYRVAVDKYPSFLRAWRGLGQIYTQRGDFDRAADAFIKVVQLGGSDPITYGLLGVSHAQGGNYTAAESALRMAAMMDPETVQWRAYLADTFFRQGRFQDAVALIETLITEDPDNVQYWMMQAGAFIRLGEPLRAAENYELVYKLGEADGESLSNLADIYINEQLFDLGVDAYLRGLELDAKAVLKRSLKASRVLAARAQYPALQTLIVGIEGHAADQIDDEIKKDLLKLRSRIAVANGAGDEEVRILEQIIEIDPLDGDALVLLGQNAARNDDHERAVFLYERAASIEEHEAEAKMHHGVLLAGQGKYAEALTLLNRSMELRPKNSLADYIEKVERIAQNR